jgi:Predicted transcriptional regulator
MDVLPTLSKREEELMEMLWDQGYPMTSSEMLQVDRSRSWKDSYLTIMLRSLQEKGFIQICGVERQGKVYLRQFESIYSREEYVAKLAMTKLQGGNLAEMLRHLAKESRERLSELEVAQIALRMVGTQEIQDDSRLLQRLVHCIQQLQEDTE